MAKKKLLLVGESWVSTANHVKGWDSFSSITFHLGAEPLVNALQDSPFELTYMKAHDAASDFPSTLAGLQHYDAVLLSDIGSNTLLLHPDVWLHGNTFPNRLKLIREYTEQGGGLMMIGGYFSFQGIDGKARWRKTPVEDVLPVTCHPWDDRVEIPEGAVAGAAPTLPTRRPFSPPQVSHQQLVSVKALVRQSVSPARQYDGDSA